MPANRSTTEQVLPWVEAQDALPAPDQAWGVHSRAPGLLAAGADLSVARLLAAYAQGTFPWFSEGQPVLWWSPDPRMVLHVQRFQLHTSLRKTLRRFVAQPNSVIRFNHNFFAVIQHCAQVKRGGQQGTWIVPEMVQAYTQLHQAGHAHSVEVWQDGELTGGLYCVSLGRAVFGESMFALRTDASKIALAALVCFCRAHGIALVDCQQNTRHLASLGAAEIPRSDFLAHIRQAQQAPAPVWTFETVYWQQLISMDRSL